MKNRLSAQGRFIPYAFWETIYEYGTAQTVSVLTSLLAFTDLGSDFREICVFLNNTDATDQVHLIVDVSHGGTNPCDSARQEKIISATKEDFIQISDPQPFTYIRVSAQTNSPGFPSADVQWAVIGLRR